MGVNHGELLQGMFKEDKKLGIAPSPREKSNWRCRMSDTSKTGNRRCFSSARVIFPTILRAIWGPALLGSLRSILASGEASREDVLQWLEIRVRSRDEERCYTFVLHFPNPPDVLDKEKTMVAGGNFVVKPVPFSRLPSRIIVCSPSQRAEPFRCLLWIRSNWRLRPLGASEFTSRDFRSREE